MLSPDNARPVGDIACTRIPAPAWRRRHAPAMSLGVHVAKPHCSRTNGQNRSTSS
jgi:hypothetical protein